jgi:hypothetical protein
MVAVTALNILVNTLIMIKMTYQKIRFSCRKMCYRYNQLKLKKEREEKEAKEMNPENNNQVIRILIKHQRLAAFLQPKW